MGSAQAIILSKYGDPDHQYLSTFCGMWMVLNDFPWFPNHPSAPVDKGIFINTDFKNKLKVAFQNLEKNNKHTEIQTYDGCHVDRMVRGNENTHGYGAESLHGWAMAIDLNASTEKLGQIEVGWSGQFIAIMKAAGLYWGCDWVHRKDNMHFALFNG